MQPRYFDIIPISSEADFEATLERIARLRDAEPGSRDADELEILVALAEAYEAERALARVDPMVWQAALR